MNDRPRERPKAPAGRPLAVAASVVVATAGVYFLIGGPWAARIGYAFAGAARPALGLLLLIAAVGLLWVDARARRRPPTVVLYTREHCGLCEEAAILLRQVAAETGHHVWEEDVDRDPALAAKYGDRVPVGVLGDEELFEFKVDVERLRARLKT